MARWSRRDPSTGAIAWTLSVLQGKESKPILNLEPYSKALAGKLRTKDKFEIQSIRLTTAAGKEAVDFRGVTGGNVRLWKRQVWILVDPDRFIILMISGPITMKPRMDRICDTVLTTFQLIDPKTAKAQREENLRRGKELLASMTTRKLDKAIRVKPRWLLMQMKGKHAGFMRVVESRAAHGVDNGYEVRRWVLLRLGSTPQRLLKGVAFTTGDRSVERWWEHLRIGTENNILETHEEGIKQKDMILSNITQGGAVRTQKRPVHEGIYLPRAMGMLLPRLVDLKTPNSYSFASYTTSANDFDIRTFTVVGPENIEIDGDQVKTIRITDQPAADQPPTDVWLDGNGDLVRMQTADGLVMTPATHRGILAHFPDADELLRLLGP